MEGCHNQLSLAGTESEETSPQQPDAQPAVPKALLDTSESHIGAEEGKKTSYCGWFRVLAARVGIWLVDG